MKRTTLALWAVMLAVLVGNAASANDEQIATQIIERLQQQQQRAQLQGFNIGVQVEQGTVTVMGTVSETDHALLALDIARRVPGVKLVVNDLYVQPKAGEAAQPTIQPTVATVAAAAPVADKSPTFTAPSGSPIAGLDIAQPTAMPQPQVPQAPAMPVATAPIGSGAQPAPPMLQQPRPAQQPAPAKLAAPAQPMAQPIAAAPAGAQPVTARKPVARKPVAFGPASSITARQMAPAAQQATPAQYTYSYSQTATGAPVPIAMTAAAGAGGAGVAQASYDNPQMPGYAWPSYAAYPNYAALTYPHQYSATAWPYIGPFYPYPQVPLGWRKVTLEWDDGWWFLDFKSKTKH